MFLSILFFQKHGYKTYIKVKAWFCAGDAVYRLCIRPFCCALQTATQRPQTPALHSDFHLRAQSVFPAGGAGGDGWFSGPFGF